MENVGAGILLFDAQAASSDFAAQVRNRVYLNQTDVLYITRSFFLSTYVGISVRFYSSPINSSPGPNPSHDRV